MKKLLLPSLLTFTFLTSFSCLAQVDTKQVDQAFGVICKAIERHNVPFSSIGLVRVLLQITDELQDLGAEEYGMTIERVVQYFVDHGCDLHQTFTFKDVLGSDGSEIFDDKIIAALQQKDFDLSFFNDQITLAEFFSFKKQIQEILQAHGCKAAKENFLLSLMSKYVALGATLNLNVLSDQDVQDDLGSDDVSDIQAVLTDEHNYKLACLMTIGYVVDYLLDLADQDLQQTIKEQYFQK
jgi:hypothetical protein